MTKVWEGKKFIAQKEGKEVIISALNHYKKRLSTIELDQSVKEMGASFGMIFKQEAQKNLKVINPLIQKISSESIDDSLQDSIPILEKALSCYHADILKIEKTRIENCSELFDEPKNLKEQLPLVNNALEIINSFH